ncbi:hypothetical protein LTR16_001441 [Cryomyces antarcticus]|uniref:Potassium transport protein n=1 Tax=Cryomyces antarcticus TaxID=329879 RepID=A0ABR0KU77_9PEZI|nr:hypothetical protein LTR39_001465 [Cryomyces antarcticus]KAK5130548.1 hypothetical protein LTR16_001441 [Cryomyces antarcticus]
MVGTQLRIRPPIVLEQLTRAFRFLRSHLPPLNFLTIHYAYFIATCLVSAIIFWGSSTPSRSVSFTDSLFLTVSAMTLAGLNTVNLSALNTFQQFLLFLLILLGSAIFVSAFVVHVRRRAFENKFKIIIEEHREKVRRMRSGSQGRFSMSLARGNSQIAAEAEETARGRTPSKVQGPYRQTVVAEARGHVLEALDTARDLTPPERRGGPEMNRLPGTLLHGNEHAVEDDDTGVVAGSQRSGSRDDHLKFHAGAAFQPSLSRYGIHHRHSRLSFLSMTGVGARSAVGLQRLTPISFAELTAGRNHPTGKSTRKYFHSDGVISRNSQFSNLSEAERERLGGVEYRAIELLSWLVPSYYVAWQLFGCIGLDAYVANNRPEVARMNGLNPFWVGASNAVSAFNNSGMSLLDANMIAFQTSYYMLITMSLLILAGNTCYPIFLRLIVWTFLKLTPDTAAWKEQRITLRFLLDHPRRCYTNFFPSQHTWWLLTAVIILNGIDWAAFEILNISNSALQPLPTYIKVIDGLFQAFAVRSGGFYVVAIPTLKIALQVLYVIMMYISVYPVVITMRSSNVYEERSLGIYADDPGVGDSTADASASRAFFGGLKRHLTSVAQGNSKSVFVQQQLRAQLAHDAWWIVLAVFIIMIIEGGQYERDPATFSVFNFIFEIVSGYGCVGISVGLPDQAYSFCGSWHDLSKLVLCAVMLRGRHRGLPVAIDRAVLLPGEQSNAAEEEDAWLRMERTMSRGQGLSRGKATEKTDVEESRGAHVV